MHLYYEQRSDGGSRFYRMSWQESIPESGSLAWLVRLRWGFVGQAGQQRKLWFSYREEALRKILHLHRLRLRQGYERLHRPTAEQSRFEFLFAEGTEQLDLFLPRSAA
ncbi:MAG: WGR domain-containing protein [bacterium]